MESHSAFQVATKVTMYAQWRSLDDYEAMRRDPGPVPYLQEALTIATFEPGIYDVVESFAPLAAKSFGESGCEASLVDNALKPLD